MRLVLLVIVLVSSGCALTAKVHGGGIVDDRGLGFQAGIGVGFGLAGKRSAVVLSAGGITGTAPELGLNGGLDVFVLPERLEKHTLAARFGFGGAALVLGNPGFVGFRLAPLYIVRVRDNHRGRALRAIGMEAMGGATIYDPLDANPSYSSFAGAMSVSYELLSIDRWSLW